MSELNRNQKKAIEALMACPSVAAAARRCGLSPRTIWRYLDDAEFQAALEARQDAETRVLTASLAGLGCDAIKALHKLVTDTETPPSVRARVALGWLDQRRKALELDALTRRVSQIENEMEKRNGAGKSN